VPVLSIKLTLVDQRGARILPAIYSDNYLTLLPGEAREVQVRYPGALKSGATINVRGWNAVNASTRVH
ncbi:MAG TPA: glycoside hydrolase family 2 protein, partial [Steroidobacteraceae bacterium]|nr:glycoside hydrolase family 2 protein [Steroidobacteraceae bacterium]